jgi:beta-glucosidase
VIEAVADANPNTIVVLETGNPVTMPWHDKVKAVVEAWYPGQVGDARSHRRGEPIRTAADQPPANLAQTPRPELPGMGTPWGTPTTISYDEGAEVGYRWFAKTNATPLYPFGHGLG